MLNVVNFESGPVVRADLIQVMMPAFTVKYHNELVCPSLADEGNFLVKETFSIETSWEAHIENFDEPIEAGISEYVLENNIDLKKFLAMLPEPLLESDSDEISRHIGKIKALKRNYRELAASGLDDAELESKNTEYALRCKRFTTLLGKSKDKETLGVLDKEQKKVGEFKTLTELKKFFANDYMINFSRNDITNIVAPPFIQDEEEELSLPSYSRFSFQTPPEEESAVALEQDTENENQTDSDDM
jgi:hypothetical protein